MTSTKVILQDRLKIISQHWLTRKATWLLFGQGMNFFLQGAYFVLLARLLGVTEYGIFAGAMALVNIITPYSKLGSNMVYMRYVTRDNSKASVYWGNALVITSAISILIAVVLFLIGPAITSLRSHLIFAVLVLANCLFNQVTSLASTVFQTIEKMRLTATLNFITNLARLLVLLVMFVTMHHATAIQWSVAVLLASGFATIPALKWVKSEIGSIQVSLSMIRVHLKEGFGYSFAGTTQSVYNDVDKTMLSHYGLHRENGFYSLAYRIVDFASSPIYALDSAVLPRYFRLSRGELSSVIRLALKSTSTAIVSGLIIGASVLLVAPVVPRLVGRDFGGALIALHWLCWIPLLRGIHCLTGSALTGTGHQNDRTGAQFSVAALNLLLNFLWIPRFGWIGACWSSVASDGSLAVLNVFLLYWVWRRSQRHDRAGSGESVLP